MNLSTQPSIVTDLTPFLQPGREEFRAIFEHAAAGMATATCDGQLLQVNPAFCNFLGYAGDELETLSVFDITHPADLQQTREIFFNGNSETSRVHHYQKRYVRRDGDHVWALTSVVWVKGREDRAAYCVALIQDISQVKAADEELQRREEIYRTLVENLDFGIALVDENHRIIMVNSARARMFGKHAEAFPHRHCFSAFNKGAGICQSCPGARALRTGRPESHTSELRLPDGRRLITRIQAFPVFNGEGRADRFIEVCEDTTQQLEIKQRLQENQQQLEFLANYDPVTRLPNRFLLFERLTRMIGKFSPDETHAHLLVVGLDRFKRINEALGYEIGDQALAEVGRRLQSCVRSSDTVARTGSSEFAVVLEGVKEIHSVVTVAEKILRTCGRPFVIEGQELFMAASLGISRYPEDGNTPGRLLKAAEVAMDKCKTELDGGYRFYTSDLDARSRELLELESCLARAIDQGELLLHYQPQIDLDSGRLIGVEALLRWDRPGHGLVSPGDFIPLAEATGLIHPMGEWALRAACEQAVAWRHQGLPPVLMAANISPRQFHQPGLAERVRNILQDTGMDPAYLEIEITESTIMNDIDQAVRTMQEINGLGVRLAIDDFGTGYSSLGALKRFPIQKLKIDQTFVRDLTSDSNDAAITDAVIALARAMSLEVIAEGIETESQLAFLRDKHCDQGQGFLFSRPLPADACRRWVAEPGQPLYPPHRP